jgi:hypothetical protein
MKSITLSRRRALQSLLATAALPLATTASTSARAQAQDRRFLFVVCASGGADIRDSFLPLVTGEAGANVRSHLASDVRTIGGLRCVDRQDPLRFYVGAGSQAGQNGPVQRTFLEEHGNDVAVAAVNGTSVNHIVAARRWLNGAGQVMRGRTLLESHALAYATPDMPLPAVTLANGGYLDPGDDVALPDVARAETVQNALLFGLATDPSRGVLPIDRGAQKEALLRRARRVRESLDDDSSFVARFTNDRLLQGFRRRRKETVPLLQELDLITELTMVASGQVPLDAFGLSSSSELPALADAGFADLASDPFMAQAALAYLLTKSGASCAVAIGAPGAPIAGAGYPGQAFTLTHTPLACDFSHTDHPATQLAMWDRTLAMTGGLIRLLKATSFGTGTMWDRSLVYIATEFGRSVRGQGNGEFGSGHELSNGAVLVSPLLNGGRVYGRLDAQSGLVRGFDAESGAANDDVVGVGEPELCATIGQALGHELQPSDADRVLPCMIA